jgi:hypothetical protein
MRIQLTKNFYQDEFACKCGCGTIPPMDLNFIMMVQELRNRCGFAIIINRGWSCEEWNAKVGGVPNSWHRHGFAIDVHCVDSKKRIIIVKHAIDIGFKDISIAKTFIHLDNGHRSVPQMRVY